MQKSKVTTEDVARQLAGITHILESIAEEASAETKVVIEQARDILVKITGRPDNPFTTLSTDCSSPPANSTPALFDSTNITTRKFDITDFESVEVDCAFIFEIIAGKTFSVAVTANESLFDSINVAKSGDTLRISLKPVRFRARPVLEARVVMPILKKLRQSAATRGAVAGFRSNDTFDLFLSGASSIDLDIESNDARLEISGASSISGNLRSRKVDILLSGASRGRLGGRCQNLSLSAWGAAEIDLSDFLTEDGTIYLKGASQATVNINGRLDVDLTGASRLEYVGNPSLSDISLSGASILNQFGIPF
jgi:hypothetical protein